MPFKIPNSLDSLLYLNAGLGGDALFSYDAIVDSSSLFEALTRSPTQADRLANPVAESRVIDGVPADAATRGGPAKPDQRDKPAEPDERAGVDASAAAGASDE